MTANAIAAMRASPIATRPLARARTSRIEPFIAASARCRLDHCLQIVKQLASVIALLIGLFDPIVGNNLQQGLPTLEFCRRESLDGLAFLLGVLAAAFVSGLPRPADQCRAGFAARPHQGRLIL